MTIIDRETRISELLKEPGALEAITDLSPSFLKFRNPILGKIMAKRTTIAVACRIGNCKVEDFMSSMEEIGFVIRKTANPADTNGNSGPETDWLPEFAEEDIVEMDVRPIIASGNDPLKDILATLQKMKNTQVLKIVNTFEPSPLIHLLSERGFSYHTDRKSADLVITYFSNRPENFDLTETPKELGEPMEVLRGRFSDRLKEIDVRGLTPPQPMVNILSELENMSADEALFVQHERIPVFLFPELEQRGYLFSLRDVSKGDIQLIIYRK